MAGVGVAWCHFTAGEGKIYNIVRIDLKSLLIEIFMQKLFLQCFYVQLAFPSGSESECFEVFGS